MCSSSVKHVTYTFFFYFIGVSSHFRFSAYTILLGSIYISWWVAFIHTVYPDNIKLEINEHFFSIILIKYTLKWVVKNLYRELNSHIMKMKEKYLCYNKKKNWMSGTHSLVINVVWVMYVIRWKQTYSYRSRTDNLCVY